MLARAWPPGYDRRLRAWPRPARSRRGQRFAQFVVPVVAHQPPADRDMVGVGGQNVRNPIDEPRVLARRPHGVLNGVWVLWRDYPANVILTVGTEPRGVSGVDHADGVAHRSPQHLLVVIQQRPHIQERTTRRRAVPDVPVATPTSPTRDPPIARSSSATRERASGSPLSDTALAVVEESGEFSPQVRGRLSRSRRSEPKRTVLGERNDRPLPGHRPRSQPPGIGSGGASKNGNTMRSAMPSNSPDHSNERISS